MANSINSVGSLVVVVLGVIGWLVYAVRFIPRAPLTPSVFPRAFIMFFAAALLSSIRGVSFNPHGLLRLITIVCAGGVLALARLYPRDTHRVLSALAWAVTLAVWLEFGSLRERSGLGNVNMTASLLLLLMPWGGGSLNILALLFTGSRGAILGAVGAYLFKWRTMMTRWILIGGSIAVLLSLGLVIALRPATVAVRIDEARMGLAWFVQRPLLGWGPGSAIYLFDDPGKIHFDNGPLTVLVEMGLVGLAAYGYLFYSIAKAMPPGPSRWGLLAWSLHQLTDDTLWWPWVLLAVAANVGLGLEGYQLPARQEIQDRAYLEAVNNS